MKNKEESPEQTGAYLSYVTVCEGGSDKVIRGIARKTPTILRLLSPPTERNV